MDSEVKTSTEGTQTSTDGTQDARTFTQDDVNRIVQERLAKEKGKGNPDLDKRAAELDMRERKMNAVQKLRDNGLPDYLVDALNLNTDEDLEKSIEAINKMKGETGGAGSQESVLIGKGNPIGTVTKFGESSDPIRQAFGLK